MSMWGVWRPDGDEIHIVPCDRDGHVIGGHSRAECFCRPKPDPEYPEVIVHHDPERGGCNA